jgi:hypothetical protein
MKEEQGSLFQQKKKKMVAAQIEPLTIEIQCDGPACNLLNIFMYFILCFVFSKALYNCFFSGDLRSREICSFWSLI